MAASVLRCITAFYMCCLHWTQRSFAYKSRLWWVEQEVKGRCRFSRSEGWSSLTLTSLLSQSTVREHGDEVVTEGFTQAWPRWHLVAVHAGAFEEAAVKAHLWSRGPEAAGVQSFLWYPWWCCETGGASPHALPILKEFSKKHLLSYHISREGLTDDNVLQCCHQVLHRTTSSDWVCGHCRQNNSISEGRKVWLSDRPTFSKDFSGRQLQGSCGE